MGGKKKDWREGLTFIPSDPCGLPDALRGEELKAIPEPPQWVRDVLADESCHPAWVVAEAIEETRKVQAILRQHKTAKMQAYVPVDQRKAMAIRANQDAKAIKRRKAANEKAVQS